MKFFSYTDRIDYIIVIILSNLLFFSFLYAQEDFQKDELYAESYDFANIEQLVEKMQNDIHSAHENLIATQETLPEKQLKQMEQFISLVQTNLSNLQEDGLLFEALENAIKDLKQIRKGFRDKATDPTLSPEYYESYNNLVRKVDLQLEALYERKLLIFEQQNDLRNVVKGWEEQKDYIAALILLGEMTSAHEELVKFIAAAKQLNESLTQFSTDMMFSVVPSEDQLPERESE